MRGLITLYPILRLCHRLVPPRQRASRAHSLHKEIHKRTTCSAMYSNSVVIGPPLEKSSLDTRSYRALTLPNALKVLLVSDPETDKAAAAMDVSVGHFSDPDEIPGLAHFLEHMLFLGTEKYPDEGAYAKFLAENGGYCNAYTAAENTNYQFQLATTTTTKPPSGEHGAVEESVDQPKSTLYEALCRFSQFFTAPLFTEGATSRELNAVDSEHEKNLQNDYLRLYQLQKSTANALHPFHKFGTGSKQTLWDDARAKNIDTRGELLKFYDRFYSANLMNLCVTGPYSLDVMQDWVVELFSNVADKNRSHPATEYAEHPPMTANEMGRMAHVVSIKDIRLLEMSWVIPPTKKQYRTKPGEYISHLLGHEGQGSLLSLLKREGWADSLSAGPAHSSENFAIFEVNVELTAEGVNHIDKILELTYGYLHMIRDKGIEKWIYEEAAALAEMRFKFSERTEPFALVERLAQQMSTYPEAQWLSGAYLLVDYNPDCILDVLNHLTPERVNVTVAGKFVEGSTNKKEPWYGTAYRQDFISEDMIGLWKNAKPNSELHIPYKNPFIPEKFDLLAEPLPVKDVDLSGPLKVLETKQVELFYKLDRTFRRPKASIRMKMICPVAYSSPRNSVMTNLFTLLLEDSLNEYAYDAVVAGMRYSLRNVTYGMHLAVDGYNDRLHVLASAIIEKIAAFKVDSDRFGKIRDQLERDFANFQKEQPYEHAMYNISFLLESPRWHVDDYLSCLRDGSVTVAAVEAFVPVLLGRMFSVILVHGNVNEDWAKKFAANVTNMLHYQPIGQAEIPRRRIGQLPNDFAVLTRKKGLNDDDRNSAVQLLYQVGPRGDLKLDVTLELLAKIMNKPFFHELRTQQQLGYIVFEGVDDHEGVTGIYVIVQSTVADPEELCRRIDDFLKQYRAQLLAELPDSEFASYVRSQITLKMEKDKRMSARTARFWKEISSEEFVYDRAMREIEALHAVKKSDVVDLFDRYIAPGGSCRRKLSSLVYGCDHPIPESESVDSGVKLVKDPVAFRLSLPLFPVKGERDIFY
jgi:insulysin